jgi:hypothetical protein
MATVMNKRQLFLALAIAPLAVPFVFGLISTAANLTDPGYGLFTFGVVSIYLPLIYLAECVFAIPVWIIFRRYKIRSSLAFAAGGAAIGWIVARWFVGDWFTRYDLEFVIAAATSAILFRTVLFRGGPI